MNELHLPDGLPNFSKRDIKFAESCSVARVRAEQIGSYEMHVIHLETELAIAGSTNPGTLGGELLEKLNEARGELRRLYKEHQKAIAEIWEMRSH